LFGKEWLKEDFMIFHCFKINILFLLLICIISFKPLIAQQSSQTIKIGIYDSRAVAVAYSNSDSFQKDIGNLTDQYKKAKEENNTKMIEIIEKEGQFRQQLLHEQTFSVGTITNIIDKIKDKLEEIAKKTGVNLIISKWEISYKDPSFEYIDVTSQIVDLFTPSKQTLIWIKDLQQQTPIPIDKISIDSGK
jgi:Skp family chaperone for outer membrane proteins